MATPAGQASLPGGEGEGELVLGEPAAGVAHPPRLAEDRQAGPAVADERRRPAALPAVVSSGQLAARRPGSLSRAAAVFAASYLAVWELAGLAAFAACWGQCRSHRGRQAGNAVGAGLRYGRVASAPAPAQLIGLGLWVALDPSPVPGLMPPV